VDKGFFLFRSGNQQLAAMEQHCIDRAVQAAPETQWNPQPGLPKPFIDREKA
jgi:hypothetical protein